jgi:hypothetical protein
MLSLKTERMIHMAILKDFTADALKVKVMDSRDHMGRVAGKEAAPGAPTGGRGGQATAGEGVSN